MKKIIAALVATLAISTPASAADLEAEVMEWAVEPCVRVRAALDAADLDEATMQMGVKLDHIVTIMAAEKRNAAQQLAKNIKPGTPWKKRAALYAATLRVCIMQTPKLK